MNINEIEVNVTPNDIHITDSWMLTKDGIFALLTAIRAGGFEDCEVLKRSDTSLCLEWATHKALYKMGFQKERTKDADLDWPQKWYVSLGYWIVGFLVWPFVR